jgi:hypothetical protein
MEGHVQCVRRLGRELRATCSGDRTAHRQLRIIVTVDDVMRNARMIGIFRFQLFKDIGSLELFCIGLVGKVTPRPLRGARQTLNVDLRDTLRPTLLDCTPLRGDWAGRQRISHGRFDLPGVFFGVIVHEGNVRTDFGYRNGNHSIRGRCASTSHAQDHFCPTPQS